MQDMSMKAENHCNESKGRVKYSHGKLLCGSKQCIQLRRTEAALPRPGSLGQAACVCRRATDAVRRSQQQGIAAGSCCIQQSSSCKLAQQALPPRQQQRFAHLPAAQQQAAARVVCPQPLQQPLRQLPAAGQPPRGSRLF